MLVFIVVGSVFTVAYSIRVIYGAFASKKPTHPTGGGICHEVTQMKPITVRLWAPPAVLVGLTIFFGLRPIIISNAINQHLDSKYAHLASAGHGEHGEAAAHATDLALWHGWEPALFLSLGTIFLVTSSFSLAKCIRDAQDSQYVVSRLDQARVDKILADHDPFRSVS